MSGHALAFGVQGARSSRIVADIRQVVIAGWTGRDPVARDRHIAELAALGIPRPAATPVFYRVAPARLTVSDAIACSGEHSSGEVEYVLVRSGGRTYVGVGSDHTDRQVETYNITVSKQMCDKPVAAELWEFDEVEPHWDGIVLRAWATVEGVRRLYQEGTLAAMLPPGDLIERGFGAAGLPDGTALFGGTLPAIGGIRPASRFDYEIDDPVLGRTIAGGYDVATLPVAG